MTLRTTFKVHDQFCGAGGSSLGVRRASERYGGGIDVSLAMNHWKLAIETHSTNFPNTDHDCADMSAVDPRRYSSADLLITSPECTNHSLAKGVKRKYQNTQTLFGDLFCDPSAERSRATMWDFIVENFGCSTAKSIANVIGCQATKDKYGLVSSEAVNAFFTYYYGKSSPSGLAEPLHTVTTKDRAAIVLNPIQNIDINECTYRMLRPHEVQLAMAFDKDYVICGNSKEQVKQLGNAVTPPVMEDLIDRVVQSFL
ncbi:MAG: DNA cytosine methyltransferase [Suipraeoptans sp.]